MQSKSKRLTILVVIIIGVLGMMTSLYQFFSSADISMALLSFFVGLSLVVSGIWSARQSKEEHQKS